MRASRQRADESGQQPAQESRGEIASVDEYEVAVWAVS
jgi:hypothetical protein